MFLNGFPKEFEEVLKNILLSRNNFVFVASEFHHIHEKTDSYFQFFYKMFSAAGFEFQNASVVDGRMTKEEAKEAVKKADVVWLAGGDTPTQFKYFEEYDLCSVLREHKGVILGMSAGAINMGKVAVCSCTCGHTVQEVYQGLELVDISVEPHLNENGVTDEILQLSMNHPIYGMYDDSVIIYNGEQVDYLGDIYFINKGKVTQISGS
jgi:dipeptidase E